MIEIVFGESACGSLKIAQTYGKGKYRGSAVSIFMRHEDGSVPSSDEMKKAQLQAQEQERIAWENAIPLGGKSSDVYCFDMALSVGDISDNGIGEQRKNIFKKNKLVDMRLEDTIDKETYDRKYLDLSSQIEQLQKECESLQNAAETESTMRKRVATFRQTLEQNEVLDTFDRHIFESIVEKVIVGGYDSDGNKDPYMIVFVYKTGFKNSVDGKNFKPLRKNSKENHSPAVLCSHASNEAESMCSDSSDDTY